MDVEMRHFLAGIQAGVGEEAVAVFDQPGFASDFSNRSYKAGYFGVSRIGRKIIPRNEGTLGNHQDVSWRERIDVMEG